MIVRYLISVLLLLSIGGCSVSKDFSDLDRFLREVDERPRGKIEPLPPIQVYRAFTYSAAAKRSPFVPPQDVVLKDIDVAPREDNVKPNTDRAKEVLEFFSLSQLSMVGTLKRNESDDLLGLISDAEGGVHMIRPGQYMGKNHGRIVALSEGRVDLIEIVPNGHGGWLERPRSISLNDGLN